MFEELGATYVGMSSRLFEVPGLFTDGAGPSPLTFLLPMYLPLMCVNFFLVIGNEGAMGGFTVSRKLIVRVGIINFSDSLGLNLGQWQL